MHILNRTKYPTAILLASLLAGCGDATEADSPTTNNVVKAGSAPALTNNNSLISISGRVESAGPNSFVLDYGPDTVVVEMDDWDRYSEGRMIKSGDSVRVMGLVDDDLWERRAIEASSVFVRNLNAYFHANSADEEGGLFTPAYVLAEDVGADAVGYVTVIEGREFILGSGPSAIRIDTAGMAENPLDETGDPKVRIGDRVYAYGPLEIDPKERAEIMATGVVSLVGSGNVPAAPEASPGSADPAAGEATATAGPEAGAVQDSSASDAAQ